MELFDTATARFVAPELYWPALARAEEGSLADSDLSQTDEPAIARRMEQLRDIRAADGVAVPGEEAWLGEFLAGGPGAHAQFAVWVRGQLEERYADAAFVCGEYPVASRCVPRELWTAWSIERDDGGGLPVPEGMPSGDEYREWLEGPAEHAVAGTSSGPSPLHLVRLYRSLYHLPQHFLRLCGEGATENLELSALVVLDAAFPDRWTLEQTSEYGADIERAFDGHARREVSHPSVEEVRARALAELSDGDDLERALASARRAKGHPGNVERKLFESLGRLSEATRAETRSVLLRSGHAAPCIGSHATLLDQACRCTCGEEVRDDVTFSWGRAVDFPVYRVGDPIDWSVNDEVPPHELVSLNVGWPAVEHLRALGRAASGCPACGGEVKTLVEFQGGRVVGQTSEKLSEVRYDFQGPFVGEELTPWNEHELNWVRTFLIQSGDARAAALAKTMSPETDTALPLPVSRWFCLNREQLSGVAFERAMTIGRVVQFVSPEVKTETSIKSCAVLENVEFGDDTVDVFFPWGALGDFPAYALGDEVRFSSYSMGAPTEAEVIVRARAFRTDTGEPLDQQVDVLVQGGRVTEVRPRGATRVPQLDAIVTIDGRPFRRWPDQSFLS